MTREEYLNWLAPRVVLDSLNRNLLPSFRIAQGCFEPAYGTTSLALEANNLFGVKDNDQWQGKCYNKVSGECYDGKNYIAKASDFQAYDSWEDSIYWQGWYFENRCTTPLYHPERKHWAELIGNRDYKDCARILQEKKYGTSPEYAKRVIDYVEKHNLTKYDSMTKEEAEAMIARESEEKKMIFNVHAGHNPDGMVGCGAIGYIKESTENRKVKNEVIRLLRLLGHTVYDCTVENGTSANNVLTNIVKKCNEHKVDVDVSIHFNSVDKKLSEDGKTTGTEAWVYNAESKAMPYAQRIVNEISKLGFKNRGVKESKALYVLRKTKNPCALFELCFVNDRDDVALYDYKTMAEAIVFGLTGQRYEEPTNTEEDADIDSKTEEASGNKDVAYRVQVGYYESKTNAENMMKKLKNAGFSACIVKS